MAELIELKVPDIGDFEGVEIIEVLVAEGDRIDKDQEVITVESDKAMMEIPASQAGVIKEMKVAVGDKVSEGTVIALLDAAGETEQAATEAPAAKPQPEAPKAETTKPASAPAPQPESQAAPSVELVEPVPYAPDNKSGIKRAHASPSVRRFARD